ncbi:MAG: protein phosphatase 2C family protein [Deltaproteobacteria bacterium]|nr:protein phosphatase 2C family protein [Deltaproteobacteria bacterium]
MGLILPEWFPFGQVRASASARAAALASGNLEDLPSPDGAPTFVAGGRMTKGALPITTELFDGAVYSSRGRGYASYNEDAAGLFKDRDGRLYALVLDQAGGLGGNVRGQASETAAKAIYGALRSIAEKPSRKRPQVEWTLLEGFLSAHEALVARQQGEVSTAVAAVIDPATAYLMNSGDSGAMHFDEHGKVKLRTVMHEAPPPNEGCLIHALGLQPEGPAPDAYALDLEVGDWIVLASDGLLDAMLPDAMFAEAFTTAESAEDAVNNLVGNALRRMSTLRAKPDNITVIAIRALKKKSARKKSAKKKLDAVG